ncbi:synaptonemal complex protein 3 isoform X2 [Syngnathoides biaculeatus]|uniref:synaptonemal complex protein 3 isoform X2 n=1 Tax=Syngnathoides biaculeatus TaxID=300417 RepID=UPI002ADE013D|nr:synaptonemal complex protein 3 isoform X2 [Syngnathoides biaculeatus]
MSDGKKMKEKSFRVEDVRKLFDFSPTTDKNKAPHCGSDDLQRDKIPGEDKAPLIKRAASELGHEETAVASGSEVHNMMKDFGGDINKVMRTKRKRLESLSKTYINEGQQKIEQLWNDSYRRRKKMTDDCSEQLAAVLQQWQRASQQMDEQEKKLNNLMRQLQTVVQQIKAVQNQKLEAIQELFKQLVQVETNMEEMEKGPGGLLQQAQQDLSKEMAATQKKILREAQELACMRKSLETMLF